jgi:hypothetical protein
MTQYTGIQGQNILIVSSDPANPVEGQIWYNTTSNLLKGYQYVATNAWASGGNLNTARRSIGGAGTQTSALAFGGVDPGDSRVSSTELYNGTSWTSNPTGLGTARNVIGQAGTQTAALAFGGRTPTTFTAVTESWNGTSWSPVSSLNTGRSGLEGAGTQTAALAFGGATYTPAQPGSTGLQTATEKYNGTSWTSNPTGLNTARCDFIGCGSQTAALGFGGYVSTPPGAGGLSAATESWNGSSWTTVNSLNTARRLFGGAGTQTAALGFGGYKGGSPVNTGATESWNGTSWTTLPATMAVVRNNFGSTGTQTAALGFGNGPAGVSTEAWTGTVLTTRTITVS